MGSVSVVGMESVQVTAGLAELRPGPELAAALAGVDLSVVLCAGVDAARRGGRA